MKKIKKFLFDLILTKEQRRLIWGAVEDSYKTHLMRHDIKNKNEMVDLKNQTRFLFSEKENA